jgi:outer membrane murein-binding lipoprotein Lpp
MGSAGWPGNNYKETTMNFFSQVSKSAVALALGMTLIGGCDPSKEELEKTKDQLAKVTSERDQLKGQVDSMKVSIDAAKTENDANKAKLAESDAKLAACAPGAAPAPAAPEPHHSGSKASKPAAPKAVAAPPAPKVDTAAPVGSQANPVARPRGGNL